MSLVENIVDGALVSPAEQFADVATRGPVEASLVLVGLSLVGVSVGLFGLLVTGVVAELVLPESTGETYP